MRLKILFLSHRFFPDVGGIEVNSEILAQAFHHAGHTVRLLTWTKDTSVKQFSFEVLRQPSLLTLVQQHMWADVVYENNPCLRLSWPALFLNKPVVTALRTWVSRTNGEMHWQDKLKLRWLSRARRVIAVSDSVRKRCWPSATVIPNPYRADVFKNSSAADVKRGFVFLGRLVSDKGADLAVRALYKLYNINGDKGNSSSYSDYRLTVVGDGPERKKLETLAEELGLTPHIFFAGVLQGDDLVTCLNQHKYLLVPSVWEEPFGNVALEGMACGCLPIVSDGGGLPEAVGDAGLVFSRNNLNELTSCILNLLQDKRLEEGIRTAAANHLQAHRPDVIARRYLRVIESVK